MVMAIPKPPQNTSTDDAAIFQANSGDDNDTDDTEDPIGRGADRAGKLDMFVTPLPKEPKHTVEGGNRKPVFGGFQLTPGAKGDSAVGIGKDLT
jgi:hypothetical protein